MIFIIILKEPLMKTKNISIAAVVISLISLLFTSLTYLVQYKQYNIDYTENLIVEIKDWPIKIIETPFQKLSLEITNTSSISVSYYIKIHGDGVCIQEYKGQENLQYCKLETQVYNLSKSGTAKDSKDQVAYIKTNTYPNKDNPLESLAYSSEPRYFIMIEVISEKTGRILYSTKCFYAESFEDNKLKFYDTIIDTSDETGKLHSTCKEVTS